MMSLLAICRLFSFTIDEEHFADNSLQILHGLVVTLSHVNLESKRTFGTRRAVDCSGVATLLVTQSTGRIGGMHMMALDGSDLKHLNTVSANLALPDEFSSFHSSEK
ncbi:hypothetical protein E6O75_ATG11719 [Venturia nashicola]|uniref:Uncharacterized protein n=1 Tax=Venturia nashicola TaxID=86259 RepID=A0A4Z1NQR6_9PEZI|nr:hypothetical protein E6O75_ATG11719 [Venturia nashicola]